MTTSQPNSSNSAGRLAQVLVLVTCISATNPSYAKKADELKEGGSPRKQVMHVPDITWDSTAFRVTGQRFLHTKSGWDPDDDILVDINIKASPVEEFVVNANVVSVEDYVPHIYIEDIDFED